MISIIIFCTTFLSTFFSVFHLLCSFKYRKEPIRPINSFLGFSIIIPCFNEDKILPHIIAGLIKLEYENLEIVFINDGSNDDTMKILCEQLELFEFYKEDNAIIMKSGKYSDVFVIDKENSGKADSLNFGINFSQKELVVTLDGDCILDKHALIVMNQVFQDKEVIASGGIVHVMQYFLLNKKSKSIIALQALDYMKGFFTYKSSLAYNNALNIISGAFGVFRKQALLSVGGFRNGLGEDIDITIRLQEYAMNNNKKITYDAGAICYTECPETWRDLRKQRVRWQKAFWDALILNKRFLFKNFFKTNMCLFMVIDAAFSGTMASVSFIFNFILIAFRAYFGFSLFFIILATLAVVFNIISSIIAIKRLKKYCPMQFIGKKMNTRYLYFSIFTDLVCFSFLRVYYFFKGTFSFILNHKDWDKVKRTNNSYNI